MQQFKVFLSPTAYSMLHTHLQFIANVSPSNAHKVNRQIFKAVQTLSTLPTRNPIFEGDINSAQPYRKLLAAERYLLLYHITDDTVSVDYILDCRQEYSWLV